jgi:hypothetical protein
MAGERHGQRKADIAKADDGDTRIGRHWVGFSRSG